MSAVTATILSSNEKMKTTYEVVSIDVFKELNRIPSAQIVLLDGSVAEQKFEISDEAFFEPGKEIEIKLRREGEQGSEASVFKGLVVKQMVEASATGMLLTVEMKDAALKLTQTRRSEVYVKKSDTEIFGDLIGKAGLKKGSLDDTSFKHPEMIQYYCTDWDFILARAEVNGLVVVAEEGAIAAKKITLSGEPKHTFEFGTDEIYSFEIELDGTHQLESIESIAWDLKNQKLTQASKAKAFDLSQGNLKPASVAKAVGGQLQALSSPVALDPRVLQAWADAAMIKSRMSMIRGCITVPGSGTIQRLDPMKVAGVGKRFNGQTVVTGVRHRVDRDGWQTDVQFGLSADWFVARPNVMDVPAAGQLPGVNGLQIGVVDQFQEDPDKEFRVKVILPGIDEKKGAVWARLASPDAGKERGYFFRPEPGDEVVIGFFNDDPRQPVILGALYGSKNTPPRDMKLSQDNTEKGIVSKSGAVIGFKDDKKPSAFIQTPGSNRIIFDDDGQMIKISDQHGNSITMSKDGIELKSAKDLKIDASGNVEIKGSKVDIK
jgi:Rhs element Vgr protein